MELSPAEAKLVRRTARRYMQSMNRDRRIRHLERSLPRQACAAFMLNGDLRRLRKKCPELKMSDHLPRKLRLKNNRNVNVFCNSRFCSKDWANFYIEASCLMRLTSAFRDVPRNALGRVQLSLKPFKEINRRQFPLPSIDKLILAQRFEGIASKENREYGNGLAFGDTQLLLDPVRLRGVRCHDHDYRS
jgi:hypothetical protein